MLSMFKFTKVISWARHLSRKQLILIGAGVLIAGGGAYALASGGEKAQTAIIERYRSSS